MRSSFEFSRQFNKQVSFDNWVENYVSKKALIEFVMREKYIKLVNIITIKKYKNL